MLGSTLLMLLLLQPDLSTASLSAAQLAQESSTKVETIYDSEKNRTTMRLLPVLIGSDVGKYHSIHMSPHFSFPGRNAITPEIVDFELQTVVKGRLRTDLYAIFVIDGEKVFLSSNRWAVKRPIPGRVWMGERLVFRMPYETFVRVTRAKTFAIKFDGVSFPVGEMEKRTLGELLRRMESPRSNGRSSPVISGSGRGLAPAQ